MKRSLILATLGLAIATSFLGSAASCKNAQTTAPAPSAGSKVPKQQSARKAMGGLANSAWPKFHGDARNTGLSPYVGPQTNEVRWTREIGSRILGSPSIGADGTVYVGVEDGYVYALSPSDGSLKWQFEGGNSGASAPAIGLNGTMYIASGRLYAVDPRADGQRWAFGASDWYTTCSPAIGDDGTVYVGGTEFAIVWDPNTKYDVSAVSPTDGIKTWSRPVGGMILGSPAIGKDGTVYVGSDDGNLYAINHTDGSVKWMYRAGGRIWSAPAIGDDGTIYIGSEGSEVCALDPTSGRAKWVYRTKGLVLSSPAIDADGTIFIGSDDGKVYSLSPGNGTPEWSRIIGAVESSAAIGADGLVYIASDEGKVYALRNSDGRVKWSYRTGGHIFCSPAIGADGTLYVGSEEGKFYAFGQKSKP